MSSVSADLPECLHPHVDAWRLWQPAERNDQSLPFASGWCATRCQDLSQTEAETPGIDRTVMRGSPEALASALAAQEARTASLIR